MLNIFNLKQLAFIIHKILLIISEVSIIVSLKLKDLDYIIKRLLMKGAILLYFFFFPGWDNKEALTLLKMYYVASIARYNIYTVS